MVFVTEFLNDAENSMKAAAVIEDRLTYLKQRSGLVDLIAPLSTHTNRKFLLYVVNEIRTVASVIAPGAELPVTRHGNFKRLVAEMFKLGLEYEFDEETQWDLWEAMQLADAQGLAVNDVLDEQGNQIAPGTNNDLAMMLFGTYSKMTQAFIDKMNAMVFEAIQFGEITASDKRTHTGWSLNYKEPNATYDHFPDPLTGGDRWDQYATANGMMDLYRKMRVYVATNGYKPDHTIISDELYQDLLMQESTKQAASSMTVTQVGTVSPEMMLEVMRRRGIPQLIPDGNSTSTMPGTFDEMYEEEQVNKTVLRKRFHNSNRVTFIKKGMGKRCFGPTLEGTGIVGLETMDRYPRTVNTNVYIVAREKKNFPPLDVISGVASGIPIFARPKQFMSWAVKDAA
ncbi:MAG: major capsid protein [Nodosilinea sp.]